MFIVKLTRDDYNGFKFTLVKYCFCLYCFWIATYINKWIYLKIHILRLSLF